MCLPDAGFSRDAQDTPQPAISPPRGLGLGMQQTRLPVGRGIVELEAKQQRREGNVYYAEGDVEIRYEELVLRAEKLECDLATGEVRAHGKVRFEWREQFLEAEEALYNLKTGRGRFVRVRGQIKVDREPSSELLVSDNPVSFEAASVERSNDRVFEVTDAWITVCVPKNPSWKFYAPRAVIEQSRAVKMVNANFRLFGVPIIYLPYATTPLAKKRRQSGFLLPTFSNTSRKGLVLGDAFYWAPAQWADLTLGGQYLSRRGWAANTNLRATPWDNTRVGFSFFGVNDRGLPDPAGVRVPQGGHEWSITAESKLGGGWRGVTDLNRLSSLTFRLAFSETFTEAVNSEVRSTAFLTNNFHGFSLNFGGVDYKNFLTAGTPFVPETSVVLRKAPEARFGSLEQQPWKNFPVYFGFEASAGGVHRRDPQIETPGVVQRFEIAPRVTIPLRWGPWLGLTTSLTGRAMRIGSQLDVNSSGQRVVLPFPLHRETAELQVDLRPPVLGRVWETSEAKWKHTIEPQIVYRYTTGVNQFGHFLRFDEDDTITDTNEIEYGITQRWYRRISGEGQAAELLRLRVVQKYFFDTTFGGAIVPGQRNAFRALDSITAFSFADGARRWSPVVTDLKVTPGGRYDAQFRMDYDPQRGKVTALGSLLKLKPYRAAFLTLAHFAAESTDVLQPRSNQIRALVGWGELNRRGLNGSFGFSYDVRQGFLQNQLVQVSYNGSCCGIAFEYRRLALGPVRSENQFRIALLIANVGTFGNLRRQEKLF